MWGDNGSSIELRSHGGSSEETLKAMRSYGNGRRSSKLPTGHESPKSMLHPYIIKYTNSPRIQDIILDMKGNRNKLGSKNDTGQSEYRSQ